MNEAEKSDPSEVATKPANACESIRLQREPAGIREEEAVVYGFTRQLLEHHKVDAALYERGKALLGVVDIVELTALIGYYTFIALTLNAHEVPLPAGVQPPLRQP